ncbi:MAG: zinc ribbon domain-containing protein [Candidatus Heimdallarchaeaceae archaeon]
MSEIYCPECGAKHDSDKRFCENCGKDLEEVILKHKGKKLPIQYSTADKEGSQEKSGPEKVGFSRFDSRSRKDSMNPAKYYLIRTGEFFLNVVFFFVATCFEVLCTCSNED